MIDMGSWRLWTAASPYPAVQSADWKFAIEMGIRMSWMFCPLLYLY